MTDSITPSKLRDQGLYLKEINYIISDHLQLIDTELTRFSNRTGNVTIAYDLPTTNFNIGIPSSDFQIILYSSIITNLEQRGFKTRLDRQATSTTIYISWESAFDTNCMRTMSNLINSRTTTENRRK